MASRRSLLSRTIAVFQWGQKTARRHSRGSVSSHHDSTVTVVDRLCWRRCCAAEGFPQSLLQHRAPVGGFRTLRPTRQRSGTKRSRTTMEMATRQRSGAKGSHATLEMATRQRSGAKGSHTILAMATRQRSGAKESHTTLEMVTRHRSGAKGSHTALENGHTTEIWC